MDSTSLRDSYDAVADAYAEGFTADLRSKPLDRAMLNLPLEDGRLAGVVAFYSLIHLQAEERPQVHAEFARVVRPGGLVLAAFHVGEEIRHRYSWFDRPVSLDFFALRPDEVAAGLAEAGFRTEATLLRGPYANEADTERA